MLRNVLLTTVGLVLIGLMRLGFNAVALHAFDEATADALNVALSLGVLVSLPMSTAFGPTALRFIGQALGRGDEGRAAWVLRRLLLATLVGGALVSAVVLGLRDAIAASRQISGELVVHGALVAVAFTLYLYARNVLYAVNRVGLYTSLEVLAGLVFFCTLGALTWAGRPDLLLLPFVAAYAVFAVAALTAESPRLLHRAVATDVVPMRELVGYAAVLTLGVVASLSVRELVVLLAPSLPDAGQAAHLALSMSILAPLQMMPRMLRTVLFAHAAELDGRGDVAAVGRAVAESNHWLFVINVPACVLVLLLASPLVTLMGGEVTPARELAFRLLVLAALFDVLATPSANALPGIGEVGVPAYSAVVGLGLAALVWWLAWPLGVVGLSLGVLASSVVKGVAPMVAARRRLGAGVTRAPATAVGLIVASAVAWIADQLLRAPWLIAGLYAAVALAVVAPSLRELAALARSFVPGGRRPA